MNSATQARPSLFANRNFTLLFGGSSISAIGDQFTLVALPWLVLKLTGNPAALGIVLAVMAFPRAAFMLIGGAVVDRRSPRRVLLEARAANAACIVILAVLVLTGAIHMWMIYLLALGIGLSTAFAYPAGTAILPQLVELQQLRSANALFMGMRQLALIVGPVLAGFVIALGAHAVSAQHLPDARGMGLAFSIDAASFVASLVSLLMIRIRGDFHPAAAGGGMLASVAAGLHGVWKDLPLRAFVLYVAIVSVFVGGPIQVGLPVLADTRLNMGAASLGILMTANGVGMFAGSFLSGLGSRLVRGRLGLMVLGFDALSGLALAGLTLVHTTYSGAALLLCAGLLTGIVQIAIFTWIQQRVPQEMMGRTMSILIFTFMGLAPISAAIAGALLKVISLGALFGIAGLALTVIALSCLSSPQLRSIRAIKTQPTKST
ncbi:MAG: MFS transporter [Gammaproteobacteria bacterium]|nr:MFS transporter [Gammaproteobacteria bacterium]